VSLSFHNREIKQESKEISEFPCYNSSLTSLNIATGKQDLIALLNNGYDWSKVEERIFLKIIKSRIGLKKHFSIPAPAEILKTSDYEQYKNKMLLFIFSKVSNSILSAIYFFRELGLIPFEQLNNQEKMYLSYSFYYCLNHVRSIIRTYEVYKKPIPSRDLIYQTINKGITLDETFRLLSISYDHKDAKNFSQEYIATYREIYKKEGESKTRPFMNAKETLEYIHEKRIPIIVISNKGIDAINYALEKYELKKFITLAIGDTSGMKKKPDPMVFNKIIQPQFKDIQPEEILVIGDTIADLLFAKNIGAHGCWATYGYGAKEECEKFKSTYCIKTLQEIQVIFKSNESDNYVDENPVDVYKL